MKDAIASTADGSLTLHSPVHGAPYHSLHGALSESKHVFIDQGLAARAQALPSPQKDQPIRVFELGFGTGLNAGLAWAWAANCHRAVHYTGLEPFPVDAAHWKALNHASACGLSTTDFAALHEAVGQNKVAGDAHFSAQVLDQTWAAFHATTAEWPPQDVIFYDALAPSEQPDLWTTQQFKQVAEITREGGMLVTYCAKGEVRRALEAAGWQVERLPGPPGKREMLRAFKRSVRRFNVRTYAVIFDASGEKVLLSREDLPGGRKVKFPGGGVEFGEGIRDALDREIAEELGTGAQLTDVQPLYTTDFFVRSAFRPEDQILSVYFSARFADPKSDERFHHRFGTPAGCEAGLAFKWRKVQDLNLADLHFPIDRHILPLIRAAAGAISKTTGA